MYVYIDIHIYVLRERQRKRGSLGLIWWALQTSFDCVQWWWMNWVQVTLAHLKDKPTQLSSGSSGSNFSTTSGGGSRFTAARLLGSGNGSRGLVFGGGNGFTGRLSGSSKTSTTASTGGVGSMNGPLTSTYDGEGTYLIFNVGDALFISDYHSQDKVSISLLLLT